MMNTIYPFEWLDTLILQILHPDKNGIKDLSKQDLVQIEEQVARASKTVQRRLKEEIFCLLKKREIRLQIRKYHSNLVYLLDTVIENQKQNQPDSSGISSVTGLLIKSIEELLSFVENRFAAYLSLEERVPLPYLMLSRNELLLKVGTLRKNWKGNASDRRVVTIVLDKLLEFVKSFSGRKVTYRQIIYQKELLKNLEDFKGSTEQVRFFSQLDELLIERNFNSEAYIRYLKCHLTDHLKAYELPGSKIDELLLCYKEFSQLPSGEKWSFDPCHQHLKYDMDNWFRQEIMYLERKLELEPGRTAVHSDGPGPAGHRNKIACDLSADQIGLILRGADETRLIRARSMNLVFQTVVPHLSTPFKEELSYGSVRSKSYNAEDRDKEIAIAALEKIIKKIRTY